MLKFADLQYRQTCLKRLLKGPHKMWSRKTGDLSTQVYYSEKCTFGGLKGLSQHRWSKGQVQLYLVHVVHTHSYNCSVLSQRSFRLV